jgi:hypothetical protein
MHGEDPPSSRFLGRNPFDDDDATPLSASLNPPPTTSLSSIRAATHSQSPTSRSGRSISELRKLRGALIGGHSPNEVQSMELLRSDEISVPESHQDDLESCSRDSDYASRGPSLISTGSDLSPASSRSSSYESSPMQSFASSVKSMAASVTSQAASFRAPTMSLKSTSYRTPNNHKMQSSVSKMRYGTNLSPHADGEYDDRPSRRKLIVVALMILSVVLVCAIIAVAIMVFGGGIHGNKSNSSSTAMASAREQALDNILLRVSSADTFIDPLTPQAKARHWLLYDDTLWLHPAQPIPGTRVIQRYILVVLYFATGGQTSWSTNNWLAGDECHNANGNVWTGLACNSNDEVVTIAFGKQRKHMNIIVRGHGTLTISIIPVSRLLRTSGDTTLRTRLPFDITELDHQGREVVWEDTYNVGLFEESSSAGSLPQSADRRCA